MEKVKCKCRNCGKIIFMDMRDEEYSKPLLRDALIKFATCDECVEVENQRAEARDAAELEAKRKFEAEQSYNSRLAASGLEKYHLDFDPKHPAANLGLYSWMGKHHNGNVFLSGSTGQGKTRILQAFARLKLIDGLTVRFAPAADLLDEISDAYRRESAGKALMRELYAVDLLIIDDLGKEAVSATKLQRLWQLIDRRYQRTDQEANIAAGRWNPLYAEKDRRDGWQLWVATNCAAGLIASRFDACGNDAGLPLLRRIQDCCEILKTDEQNNEADVSALNT